MHLPHRLHRATTRTPVLVALSLTAALAVLVGPSASARMPVEHARHKPAVQKVVVDPRLFGVHDYHLNSLSRAGTGSIRLWDAGTTWSQMQPTADGPIDYSRLDDIVARAFANHTEVTFVVGMTPTWAAAPGWTVEDGTEAPVPADYAAFLGALMNHYKNYDGSGKPGIATYQLWNEANIATFWSGTQEQMGELAKTAYDVRASVDPRVKLLGPAQVASAGWMHAWTRGFYKLTVAGKPVWSYFDAISLNLYPLETYPTKGGTRPATPEDSIAILATMRTLLTKAGVPATFPIWDTEVNYGLRFGDARGTAALPISDSKQVAFVMRTYLLSAARGVKRVYWYAYDMGNLPPAQGGGPLANTLMTDPATQSEGNLRPAGYAFTRIQSWMKGTLIGTTKKPPCTVDSHGTYTCVVKYAKGMGRIYWNPYASAKVTLVKTARTRTDELGSSAKVKGGQKLKVDYEPVLVKSAK